VNAFDGKVAVVTGAASGIGFALAERFGAEGMKVVLADIDPVSLDAAVERLRGKNLDVLGVRTNVADPASVEELAGKAVDAFGGVHVLCNNAGVVGVERGAT
jgi:NAD(P)-dependent dehydrogenase (short-subunit alcohol dehydrogenase family)